MYNPERENITRTKMAVRGGTAKFLILIAVCELSSKRITRTTIDMSSSAGIGGTAQKVPLGPAASSSSRSKSGERYEERGKEKDVRISNITAAKGLFFIIIIPLSFPRSHIYICI